MSDLQRQVDGLADRLERMAELQWDHEKYMTPSEAAWWEELGVDPQYNAGTDDGDGGMVGASWCDRSDLVLEALDTAVLEAYETGRRPIGGGDWEPRDLVVVFTIGGPHIEVVGDEVRGYWADEHVRRGISADAAQMLAAWAGVEG